MVGNILAELEPNAMVKLLYSNQCKRKQQYDTTNKSHIS